MANTETALKEAIDLHRGRHSASRSSTTPAAWRWAPSAAARTST